MAGAAHADEVVETDNLAVVQHVDAEKTMIAVDEEEKTPPIATVAAPTSAVSAPPKRPPTAYFLFSASRRPHYQSLLGRSVVEIAKAIGAEWAALPADEKEKYADEAKRLKDEYVAAQQRYSALMPKTSATADETAPRGALAFPLARVRHLMNCDPDTKRTSKVAAIALSKAAELFVTLLASNCHRVCALAGRRTVRMSDLIIVCGDGQFEFMRANMAALEKEFEAERETKKRMDEAARDDDNDGGDDDDLHRNIEDVIPPTDENAVPTDNTTRDVTRKRVRAIPRSKTTTDGRAIKRARATIDTTKFGNIASMFKQQTATVVSKPAADEGDSDDDDIVEVNTPRTQGDRGDGAFNGHIDTADVDDEQVDGFDRRVMRVNRSKRLAVNESDDDVDGDLSVVVRDE